MLKTNKQNAKGQINQIGWFVWLLCVSFLLIMMISCICKLIKTPAKPSFLPISERRILHCLLPQIQTHTQSILYVEICNNTLHLIKNLEISNFFSVLDLNMLWMSNKKKKHVTDEFINSLEWLDHWAFILLIISTFYAV